MAILKKADSGRIQIDLTGPEGNVYVLMGYAKTYARQLGLDGNKIIEDMHASDYENAKKVFNDNFGDYVDLLE